MQKMRMLSLLGLLLASVASARVMAPPPMAVRIATADAVFVGKVTTLGDKMVPAQLEAGDDRMMQLANVEVSQDLLGKVGKKVQVGYFPPEGRRPGVVLEPKEETLFILRKHPKLPNTYVAEMYFSTVSSKDNPEFKTQVEEAKAATKTLANPLATLKSKDAEERYLAAALLLTRYRTPRPGAKLEPVPAAEGKLILEALAEADWNNRNPKFAMVPPLSLFVQLGATEKDGWTRPTNFAEFGPKAKEWLKANAGTFKLMRYASPKPGLSEEP
jgi:hypothetical protein